MDAFEWHQHWWDGTQHVVQHPHLSPWKFLKELGRRASLPPQISSTNKKMRKVGMGKLFGKKWMSILKLSQSFGICQMIYLKNLHVGCNLTMELIWEFVRDVSRSIVWPWLKASRQLATTMRWEIWMLPLRWRETKRIQYWILDFLQKLTICKKVKHSPNLGCWRQGSK